MKLFKIIDTYGQALIIVAGLLYGFIYQSNDVIAIYIWVGIWQVLSMMLHILFFKLKPVLKERKWYIWLLVVLTIAGFASLTILTVAFYFWIGLLYVSPFIAVWYLSICFRELRLLLHPHL